MSRPRFEDITQPLPGFVDATGADLVMMRYAEAELSALFTSWGYSEIRVPILERASSFSEEVIGGSPWPEWDKRGVFYIQLQNYVDSYSALPEQEPALLVPEGTISVSRWLAGEHLLGNFRPPVKLFYIMPCFRNELTTKLSQTKGRQFHQAGIEILGTNDLRGDLEVLLIAHQGFVRLGVPAESILVRVGSVGLFNAVCTETGLDESEVLTVKDLMDTIAESRAGKEPERLEPSIRSVMEIVQRYNPDGAVLDKWTILTATRTEELDSRMQQTLNYNFETDQLNRLAATARSQGIQCIIDPSVVRSHEYYTGIVYEIDIRPAGHPPLVEVAGGGRYNKLIGKFLDEGSQEVSIPAVGFAYGLERVVDILHPLVAQRTGEPSRSVTQTFQLAGPRVQYVVYDRDDQYDATLNLAAELRQQGGNVDYYVGNDRSVEAAHQYAENLNAEMAMLSEGVNER